MFEKLLERFLKWNNKKLKQNCVKKYGGHIFVENDGYEFCRICWTAKSEYLKEIKNEI